MSLPVNKSSRNYYNYFQDNVAYLNDAGTAIPIAIFVGGQYNSAAPTYADGDPAVLQMTAAGRLMVDASLTLEGDIQIGAVELKDATSDTRAKIKTDGTDNALVVIQKTLPAGTNTIGDVTVSSLPVLPTGDNVIGKIKIADSTGTKIADVTDVGDPGGHRLATSVHDGGNSITVDNSGTFAVQSTLQAGTAYVGKVRRTDGTTDETLPTTAASVSGASAANLLAAGSGKHKIFYMILNVDTAGTVTVSDGIGVFYMGAATSVVLDFRPLGLSQDTATTAITVTNGGGGNFNASLTYTDVV